MITVFVVADEPLVRAGLRMWLELAQDLRVVGEAATGEHAIQVVPAAKPHVVVLDLMLPGVNGIMVIEQLRHVAPDAAIVALSLRDGATLRARALHAGARAFVAKHEPNEALLDAIRRAAMLEP